MDEETIKKLHELAAEHNARMAPWIEELKLLMQQEYTDERWHRERIILDATFDLQRQHRAEYDAINAPHAD